MSTSLFIHCSFYPFIHLPLFIFLTLLFSCQSNSTHQPIAKDAAVNISIVKLTRQIDENLNAENHEAGIRDFITLLDYTQQLPQGSQSLMDARWQLVHYANKLGLYTQGIEIIDKMLADLKQVTGDSAIYWSELVNSAKAACYFELHQYQEARQTYAKVLYYQDLLFPDLEHASVINNIGMTFQQEGRLDSAMYYFRKVESMLNNARSVPLFGEFKNDEIFSGSVKDNIASILVNQGHYNDAEKLYRENFSMYRKYEQHPIRLVNAGIQLAHLQVRLKESSAAEHTIHALDSLFNVLSYPGKRDQQLDFFQLLTGYYQLTNDAHRLAMYQEAYIDLADSLYAVQLERSKVISEELIQYKANQFRQELDREKIEAMHQQQKARLRFWILLMFIIFTISGGLLFTISLRQRLRLARKQAELNEAERKLAAARAIAVEQEKTILDIALQHKSKDVSDLALNAMIKKEWAEKLDGLLTHAEQSRGHMRSIALRKLREEIRSHIHADHRISQLHQNIETLNSEFYDHLNSRNPDLSKTEVRLVSFLKLRMSNDEIAMLQGISTKSVIMSRYRLKKKLALPESADLDTFCQKL